MNQDVGNATLLTHYLLGELSESEETSVETRFFEDSDLLDELRGTERDLIDAFVRGELTGDSRQRFEQRFLTQPDRRRRVLFASALARLLPRRDVQVEPTAEPATRKEGRAWWSHISIGSRELLAAAAVLVIAVSVALFWRTQLGRPTPAPPIAEEQSAAAEAPRVPEETTIMGQDATSGKDSRPPTQIGRPTPPPNIAKKQPAAAGAPPIPGDVLIGQQNATIGKDFRPKTIMSALTLTPGRLRGEEGARLVVPAGVTVVRINIRLRRNDYAEYRVTLNASDGRTLWQRGHLKANRRRYLPVRIHVDRFGNHEYSLIVTGLNQSGHEDDVDSYFFEVVRQ